MLIMTLTFDSMAELDDYLENPDVVTVDILEQGTKFVLKYYVLDELPN